MIICFVNRKSITHYTNMYKDFESFFADNPYARIMFAFNEDDDLLKGTVLLKDKKYGNNYK